MAVNFYFIDKNVQEGDDGSYLHFFAANAVADRGLAVDPSNLYDTIAQARMNIGLNINFNPSANSTLSAASLDEETKNTVEKFLSGQLFNNLESPIEDDGSEPDMGGDSIAAALSSAAETAKVGNTNLAGFVKAAEDTLNQILSATNMNQTMQEYADAVLRSYVGSNGGGITGPIAQQIITDILNKNNGEFFTADLGLGNTLNSIVAQMTALIAALPAANYGKGATVTIGGTGHTQVERALIGKINGWMSYLSSNLKTVATAIGLGEIAKRSYQEIESINTHIPQSGDVTYKFDESLRSDSAAINDAYSKVLNTSYSGGPISITANVGGVSATIGIISRESGAAPITSKTKHRTINIVEDSTLFNVLARDVGISGSTMNDLIQILTWQDSPASSGMEAVASKIWTDIQAIIPQLVLINKLTASLMTTDIALDNTFFAYGGKIWPSSVVLQHIFNNLGSKNNMNASSVFFSGSLNVPRSSFASMNQWEGDERPDPNLAIQRSNVLMGNVLNKLMSTKVSVKLRLADLAALSLNSI